MTATAPVHDRLATLADPTRGRILLALDLHELTVGELCAILGLPQSTVSRHLRVLVDDHWLTTRQDGTSRYYSRKSTLEPAADRLWTVVAEDLRAGPLWERDVARLGITIAQRRAKSREFFASAGASWDERRRELFGSTVGGGALLGLIDDLWTVGDLGCGSGHLSAALAPYVGKVIGVDASPVMLNQAKVRLAGSVNAEFRAGELESMPIATGELDAAVLSLVLHYAADPVQVLAETFRVLRPGARLLLIDLLPHDRADFSQEMGHVWLGFSQEQVREWLDETGFDGVRIGELPEDLDAKGPAVFVATGRRGDGSQEQKGHKD